MGYSRKRIIQSQINAPMNVANTVCSMFNTREQRNALIQGFIWDIPMFEFLYEFLPEDIAVEVLRSIRIEDAIEIICKYQSPITIYRKVDPLLYVMRYFSTDRISDPYLNRFDRSFIPRTSTLEFVLRCKKYLTEYEFKELVQIVARG